MSRCPLSVVLEHTNQDVAERFTDLFDVDIAEADEIFTEARRWVWLCAEAREDRKAGIHVPPLVIDKPLYYIDEGWHNWILFTRDYRLACDRWFGFFVDHNPTPKRIKDSQKAALEVDRSALDAVMASRKRQYDYIYDKLGAETLETWYSTLSTKYERLSDRRRSR